MDGRPATAQPGSGQIVPMLRRVVASRAFSRGVIALIVLNAVTIGLGAFPAVAARWGSLLEQTNGVLQALFVLEIAARIASHGRRPLDFFRSGWNVFDFAVVAVSLVPAAGALATLGRLARVLRVARLLSSLPDLRLIVGTMLRSIPSMGHVILLLGLLVFVYGVVGHHWFAAADPERWGDLGRAAKTLFVIMTLEGWVEILQASQAGSAATWAFYVSFIVIAVFVVINLFVAVVINNLEKVRDEDARADRQPEAPTGPDGVALELRRLAEQVEALRRELEAAKAERRLPRGELEEPAAASPRQ